MGRSVPALMGGAAGGVGLADLAVRPPGATVDPWLRERESGRWGGRSWGRGVSGGGVELQPGTRVEIGLCGAWFGFPGGQSPGGRGENGNAGGCEGPQSRFRWEFPPELVGGAATSGRQWLEFGAGPSGVRREKRWRLD